MKIQKKKQYCIERYFKMKLTFTRHNNNKKKQIKLMMKMQKKYFVYIKREKNGELFEYMMTILAFANAKLRIYDKYVNSFRMV